MPASHVFCLTAGRTGTQWLAKMLAGSLPNCEAHHEILGYDRFGLDFPNLSHLTLFNSRGLCDEVREFWQRKFSRVARCTKPWYVETSHILMKAGLVEHLELCPGPVHLVALTRDTPSLVASYTQRGDFMNVGNRWLWYLDPNYPQNIVNAEAFKAKGVLGIRLWYCIEVAARQGYYAKMLEGRADVTLHRIDLSELRTEAGASRLMQSLGADPGFLRLPPPSNSTPTQLRLSDDSMNKVRALCSEVDGDAWSIGADYYAQGHRLGAPR